MVIFNWAKLGFIWDGLITMYFILLSVRANLLAHNYVNKLI